MNRIYKMVRSRNLILFILFILSCSLFGQGSRPPVTTLSGLSDVSITSPSSGQALLWNSGTSRWNNAAVPGGALSTLTDTSIVSPAATQLLRYDIIAGKWANYGPLSYADIAGNIPVTEFNNGTDASSATFWRGDGIWAAPPGAGAVATTSNILQGDGAGNAISTSPALAMTSTGLTAAGSNNGSFVLQLSNTTANVSAATGISEVVADGNGFMVVLGSSNAGAGLRLLDTLWISNTISAKNILLSTNNGIAQFSNDGGSTAKATIGNGIGVSASDQGVGTVNVPSTGGYYMGNTPMGQLFVNGSAAGATGFAANQAMPGSAVTVPVGFFKVGGQYHCVFDMTKTAAGTAAIAINVHMGTAGTTADAIVGTVSFIAGTAIADTGVFDVYITFKSVGSGTSAVILTYARLLHTNNTNGLSNQPTNLNVTSQTSAGFNSTTQTKISIGFNGGTSFAGTNAFTQTEYKQ